MLSIVAFVVSLIVFAVLFFSGGSGRVVWRALYSDIRGGVGNRFAYGNVSEGLFKRLLAASGISGLPVPTGPGQTLQTGTAPNDTAFWDYPENQINPRAFGAVGNGIANDYAAMQAAVATGKKIVLDAGATYLVNGASPAMALLPGQELDGNGATIATTSDITIIKIVGNFRFQVQNVRLLGNGAGAAQFGIGASDLAGGVGPSQLNVNNVTFQSLATAGILLFNSAGGVLVAPIIRGCRALNCGTGFWSLVEYAIFSSCTADACGTGFEDEAGNDVFSACIATSCTVYGFRIDAGGNDGHGMMIGCESNHNAINLRYDGVVNNGMPIVGCNFYDATTRIEIGVVGAGGAKGARFVGCTLACPVNVRDNSVAVFDGCLWPDPTVVVTIAVTGKARFEPNNVDLNGQFPALLTTAFNTRPQAWCHDVQGFIQLEPVSAAAVAAVVAAGSAAIYVDAADGVVKIRGTAGTVTPIGIP